MTRTMSAVAMSGEPMQELIARLEKANFPDGALDAAIWEATNKARYDRFVSSTLHICPKGMSQADKDEVVKIRSAQASPRYTSSFDAALTLVPPHHLWEARQGIQAKATVWRLETDYDEGGRDVPVGLATQYPALALCIAALKARDASH